MATTPLATIKNWFLTGLKPTQAQFWATWDSFWHKDNGRLIKTVAQNPWQVDITTVDGDGNEALIPLPIYNEPEYFPISKITNLQTALDNLVVKISGKGLSTEDFTAELKAKLEALENYVHPETHTIGEVDGLAEILEEITNSVNSLSDAISGITQNTYLTWRGYRLYKIAGNVETYPEAGEELKGRGNGTLFDGEIVHLTAKHDLPEEEDEFGNIVYATDEDFNHLNSYP